MNTGLAVVSADQNETPTTGPAGYAPLQLGILALLVSVLYGDVLGVMARDWWIEPAQSQGMLLPPLALYVAWRRRKQTLRYPAVLTNSGLVVTGLACAMFTLGRLASEFFLTRISFVLLLAGLVQTFWGLKRLRTLAFPLVLLATMVPLPALVYNTLAGPLQLLASDISSRVAQAVGISVFRDGNVIQLAGISLGVAEACSGLNSLSALFVGSVFMAYLMCSRLLSRLILCAASVPIAVAVNVLRVSGTAVLADYDEAFAMGFYHLFSGWLVFVIGAATLYLFAHILHAQLDGD
jgi:exosortase